MRFATNAPRPFVTVAAHAHGDSLSLGPMQSNPSRMAGLSAVLLFSSGVVFGGGSMAVGFVLGGAHAAPERAALEVAPELAPVAGTTDQTAAPEDLVEPSRPVEAPRGERGALDRALGFAVSIRSGTAYGAGTLVGEHVVLTALHVVEGRTSAEVRFRDGEWLDATVLATEPSADLALLRVDGGGRPTARVASAMALSAGDPLLTVGTPRELSFTVHRGMVSFVGRRFDRVRYVQTDLPANPGSSGGPVIDAEGRLVGVMSFILRGSEGIAFVTPIDYAGSLLAGAGVDVAELASERERFETWRDGETR